MTDSLENWMGATFFIVLAAALIALAYYKAER